MRYTLPFNIPNWNPVVGVPAGINSRGVAIGMQTFGKPQATEMALRIACAFSQGDPKFFTGSLVPKTE